MKATELMIGDYARVNRDGICIKKGTIVEIRGIKLAKENIFFAFCRSLDKDQFLDVIYCIVCEYLSPIPLTPEILEKNGFIKRISYGNYRWYLDGKNSITLNIYSERDKIWRIMIDTNRNENTIVYVTLVHELQHALKLCGIDKEIEL